MSCTPHYIKTAFERAGIYRTKLQYNNEGKRPQFHLVDIKLNNAIRETKDHKNVGNFDKNLYIETLMLKYKDKSLGSFRKTIPVTLLKDEKQMSKI